MAANDPAMNGQIIKGKYDDAQVNPLIGIARKAASDMVRFGSEFGLGPAARARICWPQCTAAARQVRWAVTLDTPKNKRLRMSALERFTDSSWASCEVRKPAQERPSTR
jgi:hypothetical protein